MLLFKLLDEWIIFSDVYGGIYCLLDFCYKNNYIVKFVYVNIVDVVVIEVVIILNIKVIFIEILLNLLMEECDVDEILKVVKKYNLILIVDNIFLIFVLFCLIEYGVDIVIYSVIKYFLGYNDVLVGLIVVKDFEVIKNEVG